MAKLILGILATLGFLAHLAVFAILIGVPIALIWNAVATPEAGPIVGAVFSPLIGIFAAWIFMKLWDLAMVPIVWILVNPFEHDQR